MDSKDEKFETYEGELSLDCPVLVIAFNRPDYLKVLIDQLRSIQPKSIYLAVDGARPDRVGEVDLVNEVRAQASTFDWGCKVSTRFSDVNLGCGLGVSSAISWAFETENELIILEDDIIPDPSFYAYCRELLNTHKDNENVFAISGCNFVPPKFLDESESYRFSQIPNVWGWATWKNSWDLYEFELDDWRSKLSMRELYKALGGSLIATLVWSKIFSLMEKKKIDTWDYQLVFAAIKNKRIVATPNVSLIENIGFGSKATHTTKTPDYILNKESVSLPLRHPNVSVNAKIEAWTLKNCFGCSYTGAFRLLVRGFLGRIRLTTKSYEKN